VARKRKVVALSVLLAAGTASCAGLWLVTDRIWGGPDHGFAFETGLGWPEAARVVFYGDSRSGWSGGDGETYLVFEADGPTIAKWLEGPPPWRAGRWHRGPVPVAIGSNVSFHTTGVFVRGSDYGEGNPDLLDLLTSGEVWYAARERESFPGKPYRQGDLVIIDPRSNRVWWTSWKG
jgi:hypothetical protein